MNYRREIDGLRALALIPVMLFHAGFQKFSGGFVGVDIFFVISGYLITSIIINEKDAGDFSIIKFYERRARRLLPALFFVLLICLTISAWLMLPKDFKLFTNSLFSVAIFSSNIQFYREIGYFDIAAELKPLLHTWSLSVEEQYYLLFPLFVIATWRIGKGWMVKILVIIASASLIAAQWGSVSQPEATFFLLPTRGWEILLGSFTAFYLPKEKVIIYRGVFGDACAVFGLILILYSVFYFDKKTPFPSLYALVPTIGAVLIILFATPKTIVGKILGARLLVGIGLISYSCYLWHQPLFAFARYASLGEPRKEFFIFLIIISILLGYFSWKFIELPFRNKSLVSRRMIFSLAAVGMLFNLIVGLVSYYYNGFENIYISSFDSRAKNIYFSDKIIDTDIDCRFSSSELSLHTIEKFNFCEKKYGKALVIVGDSHAGNLYRAILYNSNNKFIFCLSNSAFMPYAPWRKKSGDDFLRFAAENRNKIVNIIYTQAGFYLMEDKYGAHGDRGFFKKIEIPLYNPNKEYIEGVFLYLRELEKFAKVIWVGPGVEPHLNAAKLKKLSISCVKIYPRISENTLASFVELDKYLKDKSRAGAVPYFSSIDVIKFNPEFDLYNCDSLYWIDGDHWSPQGEKEFGRRIVDALFLNGLIKFFN